MAAHYQNDGDLQQQSKTITECGFQCTCCYYGALTTWALASASASNVECPAMPEKPPESKQRRRWIVGGSREAAKICAEGIEGAAVAA